MRLVALLMTPQIAAGSTPDGIQPELGPEGLPTGRSVEAFARFVPAEPDWRRVFAETPSLDLGFVAKGTSRELKEQLALGLPLASPGLLSAYGVTIRDVIDTLDFVAQVADEDRGSSYKRLEDPAWIADRFDIYRWIPDTASAAERKIALPADQIRLTSYLVFQVEGREQRDDIYNTALYALPLDELRGGPPATRMKYTRIDVYNGVFEPGGEAAGMAEPIVWLTREHANQAVMQGSIEVVIPGDPAPHMFNVHENNGIPYDPAIKDGNLQRRFWYFREVAGILGVEQIPLRPGASVAGDVFNIGLGRLVALTWERGGLTELHLAWLSDTGGAFQPNLFQLDWLAGTFPTPEAFKAWEETMPSRVSAAVLVKKRAERSP